MKRHIFFALALAALLALLSGCGIGSPSERTLREQIPAELLRYSFDGELYTSQVEELTITRRQTNEKEDTADCEVLLTGGPLNRRLEVTLYSNYYDKGGWMLDSYETIAVEKWEFSEDAGDAAVYDEARMDAQMWDGEQVDFTKAVLEDGLGHLLVRYMVDDHSPNVHIYGNVIGTANLDCSFNGECAADYWWRVNYDRDDIVYDWSPIVGTWQGEGAIRIDGTNIGYLATYAEDPCLTVKQVGTVYGYAGIEYHMSCTVRTVRDSDEYSMKDAEVVISDEKFSDEEITFDLRIGGMNSGECKLIFDYASAMLKGDNGETLYLRRVGS